MVNIDDFDIFCCLNNSEKNTTCLFAWDHNSAQGTLRLASIKNLCLKTPQASTITWRSKWSLVSAHSNWQQQEITTLKEWVKGTDSLFWDLKARRKKKKQKDLKIYFRCIYLCSVLVSFIVSSFSCQAGCIGLDSGTSWEFTKIRYWTGVGPVDSRPSIDKLHHFFPKLEKKKYDIGQKTSDMWHVICDIWHVTYDMLWEVNIL